MSAWAERLACTAKGVHVALMAHWNRSKDHLDVSALTNAVMTLTGTSGFSSDSFELSAPKDQFTDESNSIEKLTSELSSVVFLRRASH